MRSVYSLRDKRESTRRRKPHQDHRDTNTRAMNSCTLDGVSTNGSSERGDGIYNVSSRYQPLPLSDSRTYWDLVKTLYRTSLAMILGNSLEWLDFSIYGYSSAEISSQLFGGSRVAYWASFGLGFAVRPLGAYVLGKLSDEKSRKLSFILSMLAMSASTALMSLIPAVCGMPGVTLDSYCVPNLWAAAIPAIFLRCVQGFSAGAAAGGVNVIQTELWSTTERKGAIAQAVGVQNVSGGGASMVSAAVVYGLRAAMGEVRYAAWGWRIAFLIVVPPSLFASHLMHKSTPESNDFAERDGCVTGDSLLVENEESSAIELQDVRSSVDYFSGHQDHFPDEEAPINAVDTHWQSLSTIEKKIGRNLSSRVSSSSMIPNENVVPWWLLISVMIFSQFAITGFNNLGVFLVEFAQTNYGVTSNTSTLMQVVGKGVQVIMTPFAATLGDIKGWFWTSAFGGILCTILAMPMMLAGNFGGVGAAWFLVSGCLPIVSTFWILNAPLLATSIFPVECRSRWTSLVLATAAAMQGFLPLLLEEIPNAYLQGGVLMTIAAFGTVGIIWVRNQAAKGNVTIYQRAELY